MKVLYDISVLGVGQYNPLARTGVARVVENIAYGLATSSECNLLFCQSLSFQILQACLAYRASNPRFSQVPLAHSSFITSFFNKVLELNTMLDIHAKTSYAITNESQNSLLVKDLRDTLERTIKSAENYFYQLDSDRLAKANIFHATFYPIPAQARQARNVRRFLTVYDLIPVLYPHFLGGDYENHRTKNTVDSLAPEDWVICISKATKNDLCNYLKAVDPDKVFITHLAADPEMFYQCDDLSKIALIQKRYHIPEGPYLLGLSTLEPRKNLDHAIRCFAQVVREQKIKDLSLVLVGNKGWNYDKILEEASNQYLLKDRIVLTGRVADKDLAALYSGALAFLYPSFYEGFGLPPLEAMQCGVPVITSNTSSLPEVVGDAGLMLDPTDSGGLCHSILETYNKPSLREAMSLKSLEQAKRFSWEKCIQETITSYKTALCL